jgi:hypothetical protein
MVLAEHRLASLIVAVALVATVGFFLFALPKPYGYEDGGVPVVFASAKPADHGWTWSTGTPGFVFGQYDDLWNMSGLHPVELGPVRRDAARAGVVPQTLRILSSIRTSRLRPQVLVAGSNSAGRTCLGVQFHRGRSRFLCPAQLARTPGVVIVEAVPKQQGSFYPMFVTGIARADVTRVTVEAPGESYTDNRTTIAVVRPLGPQLVYTRATAGWWGTFEASTSQPGPWHAQVVFFGENGRLGAVDVSLTDPGERLVLAR